MTAVLGIDLGLTGSLALLAREGHIVWIKDMPVRQIAVGQRTRRIYDLAQLAGMMDEAWGVGTERLHVACEDIYHLGFRGSLAARSMGVGFGAVAMWCASAGQPLHAVLPSAWRKAMLAGRAKGKHASAARAAELWPRADLGDRTDEGRAEALLLAEFVRRMQP